MPSFVEKITWAYGEEYGQVFYPSDLDDLNGKLHELDAQAVANQHPL